MNAPDPPHWTLNSCFVVFHTILGAFGTIWLPYEIGAKRAELVKKFVPQSHVRIFRNEHT